MTDEIPTKKTSLDTNQESTRAESARTKARMHEHTSTVREFTSRKAICNDRWEWKACQTMQRSVGKRRQAMKDNNHASMLDLDVSCGRPRSHDWYKGLLSGQVSPESSLFVLDLQPVPCDRRGDPWNRIGLHCI